MVKITRGTFHTDDVKNIEPVPFKVTSKTNACVIAKMLFPRSMCLSGLYFVLHFVLSTLLVGTSITV